MRRDSRSQFAGQHTRVAGSGPGAASAAAPGALASSAAVQGCDTGGRIVLPWPPSANRYYRAPSRGPLAGRHLLSEEGRQYRSAVASLAVAHRWPRIPAGSLVRMDVEAWMPDRRRRDLDNTLKATQDALAHAGVLSDDAQIDDLRVARKRDSSGRLMLGGMLVVRIEVIDGRERSAA